MYILTIHRHKKSIIIHLHAELFLIISQKYVPLVQIIENNKILLGLSKMLDMFLTFILINNNLQITTTKSNCRALLLKQTLSKTTKAYIHSGQD